LYLFIRDYLPEIFTYAAIVKSSLDDILRLSRAIAAATAAHAVEDRVVTQGEIDRARELRDTCAANVAAFGGVGLGLKRTNDDVTYFIEDNEFEITADIRESRDLQARLQARAEGVLNNTLKAITLASFFYKDFPLLCKGAVASFLEYFNTHYPRAKIPFIELTVAQKKYLDDLYITIHDEETYASRFSAAGGGEAEKELSGSIKLDPINSLAMDNYEIYYSLAIKAAYENREVTEAEFLKALAKAKEKMTANVVRTPRLKPNSATVRKSPPTQGQFDPFALAKLMKGRQATGLTAEERAAVSPTFSSNGSRNSNFYVSEGGKSKYRKTQKKRHQKKSRKQMRKTRKGKK
jgi:hypothetical protein